jgi:hypothetical protein
MPTYDREAEKCNLLCGQEKRRTWILAIWECVPKGGSSHLSSKVLVRLRHVCKFPKNWERETNGAGI